jgi:hypothetical protein
MGTDLPFLPFATDHEYQAFNRFVVNGISMDEEKVEIEWCTMLMVLFPKLPVHLQKYGE